MQNAPDTTTEIASTFTIADYQAIRGSLDPASPDTPSWRHLHRAFTARIEERFLRPIRELARFDKRDLLPMRPGFAILALDCLLIDTIQSFREGRVSTGEIGPAASFRDFLRAESFKGFSNKDKADFFGYVRNALLHNGETRNDWKVRIDSKQLLTKDPITKARTINRRLFHAAVLLEHRKLARSILSGTSDDRVRFLRRMDTICGWPVKPLSHIYFAYGSCLASSEISQTAPKAEVVGRAYIPGYRLVFDKHSTTRNGDAANIIEDCTAIAWGYVYSLDNEDWEELRKRELGYDELTNVRAVLTDNTNDQQVPITVSTFAARTPCELRCGPHEGYLDLVLRGATERGLPEAYVTLIEALATPP